MNKTILLGWNREYDAKKSFGAHMISAFILLVLGLMNVMRESDNSVSERIGVVMLIVAIGPVIHGLIAYTKISKWSPKVSVNENDVRIKEKLLRQPVVIPWDQIKSIKIAPYQIIFSFVDGEFDFSYRTTADTSIDIKSTIREMAALKQIKIVEG